jgi:hypothetical protein
MLPSSYAQCILIRQITHSRPVEQAFILRFKVCQANKVGWNIWI